MKRNDTLKLGAELRAAIITVVTRAGAPITSREIRTAPEVARLNRSQNNFDNCMFRMTHSGKLAPAGKREGKLLYVIPGARPVAVRNPVNAPPVIKHNGTHSSATPTVRVDYDPQNKRLRFEVTGNLIIDIGAV